MLNYLKLISFMLLALFIVGCGGSGQITQSNGSESHAELATQSKDRIENNISSSSTIEVLSLSTSESDKKPSYFNKRQLSMIPKQIKTVRLNTLNRIPVSLFSDTYVSANDVFFSKEEGNILLHNQSYKKIKSLVGKYTDENNNTHLVKLEFDALIQPHTITSLEYFKNAKSMTIFHTSALFDQAIRYDGALCDANSDDTETTKYCMPTKEEQNHYNQSIARLHAFYNSTDALPAWIAWTKQESYKSLEFSVYDKDYQPLNEEDMIKSFMKATLPNNAMTLKSTYYVREEDGVAAGENISLLGIKENTGWASLWHEHLMPKSLSETSTENMFSVLHHEMMHGRGFCHESGMTYGFSNAIGEMIEKMDDNERYPIAEAPKYVFDVAYNKDNQMLLSVYITSMTQEQDLTVELLSAHPIGMKYHSGTENHQSILQMGNAPSMRFYLRLYGEDSTQVMSKLIYPYNFASRTSQVTKDNNNYHIVPHKNWKYLSEHNDEQIHMLPKNAEAICKAWTGSENARTEEIRKVELLDGIETPLVVHSPHCYKEYYSHTSNESRLISYDSIVNDSATSILCTIR